MPFASDIVRAAVSGETTPEFVVHRRAILGGLSSRNVAAVRVRPAAGRRTAAFVLKHLPEGGSREALVYEAVLPRLGVSAPRLVHVERSAGAVTLVLERIPRSRVWPWSDVSRSKALLSAIAALHAARVEDAATLLAGWDYEAELEQSARETLAVASELPPPWTAARWPLRAVRRIVEDLPAVRKELLADPDLPPSLLHGDLHSGNVLVRRGRVVLLDWERARVGSPLEDVASWLVSLGYHEPEARRRHDTLLVHYLAARGLPPRITPALRRRYWLASASNALAGALRYHLLRSADEALPAWERESAALNARDWMRVLRRADVYREEQKRGGQDLLLDT